MTIFNTDLDIFTVDRISTRITPIKFIKNNNLPSQEELAEIEAVIQCFIQLTQSFKHKTTCQTLQEKSIAFGKTKSPQELIVILQSLYNKVGELESGVIDIQRIAKAFVICSLALDIQGVPPILRYHISPSNLICHQLMLLSDYLWLQAVYNAGKLGPSKALPRMFGKTSSTSTRILLALNELLHKTSNAYKERARWAFIRPSIATFKFAAERQLACAPQNYGLNTLEWFLKSTAKISEQIEIKPLFRKHAITTYDQILVWQCVTVSYGRISDAARLYSIMAGCQMSRQAMAKQILRLERDLPVQLHSWLPNCKNKY